MQENRGVLGQISVWAVGTVQDVVGGMLMNMILTGVLVCKEIHFFIHLFNGQQQE